MSYESYATVKNDSWNLAENDSANNLKFQGFLVMVLELWMELLENNMIKRIKHSSISSMLN